MQKRVYAEVDPSLEKVAELGGPCSIGQVISKYF